MIDFQAIVLNVRRCTFIIARSRKRGEPVFTCTEPAEHGGLFCLEHTHQLIDKHRAEGSP